jgi:hypothetical protein
LPSNAEPRDSQRLALDAGFLDPVPGAPGKIAAVAGLGDDAFEADLAGVREHLFAVDLETFAELDGCLLDQLFQVRFAFEEWQLPQILTVEIE